MVENDLTFAALMIEVVRNRGFKGVIATRGAHALNLARELKPTAITLDILLPDCSGFSVLERLKRDASTSYIPVHVISIAEEKTRALALGAASFTQKTSGRNVLSSVVDRVRRSVELNERHALVISAEQETRDELIELVGNGVVHSQPVSTISEAIGAFAMKSFDAIIATAEFADGTVCDLIERIQATFHDGLLRVIVYAPERLAPEVSAKLNLLAENVVVRSATSQNELVEMASIFLHRNEALLSERKRNMIAEVRKHEPKLEGKKILMVDDDARNIFAITSALERAKVEVVYAENGRIAIERLREQPDVDLVLMDIMMPEMDGYEATRAIREIEQFRNLPIIAVTAKAMVGDREKCIQAGASDYIPKPVDLDQLFSLLRVWLPDRTSSAAAASNVS
jgi:CheY-like chemotaxis protein